MANNFNSATFSSTYKDDFRDSDHYHRILFNSGRALQARELTQSQTILSREIERMGRYLFKEGSIINSHMGGLLTSDVAVSFVKLDESSFELPATYSQLVGTTIRGNTSGIKAVVKKVIPATADTVATLLVQYTDSNQTVPSDTTTGIAYSPRELLITDNGNLRVATTNTPSNPAVGRGSMIETQANEMFVLGHFVTVQAQTLVIDAYNDFPTAGVGFKVVEDIVTTTDTTALYDNAGATPNLTSPGADRYRISLVLTLESDTTVNDTFIKIIDVVNGSSREVQNEDNILNQLGKTITRRTAEESGNYIPQIGERFKLGVVKDSAEDTTLKYTVGTGVAYIDGSRVENKQPYRLADVPAARTTETIVGETIGVQYGNYFLCDSLFGGLWQETRDYGDVTLKNSEDFGGTTIGTAKVKDVSRIVNDSVEYWQIHIFDLAMDSDGSGRVYSSSDTASIGTSSSNCGNTIQENGSVRLYDPTKKFLIFPLPRDRSKRVTEDTLTMVVKDFKEVAATGSSISITPNDKFQTEEFADAINWTIIDTTDGNTQNISASSTFAFSTSPNGLRSATITGTQTGRTYRVAFYVSVVGKMKTKSLQTVTETITPDANGKVFMKADVYKVISATSGGTDVLKRYRVHDGATAATYGKGFLDPRKGFTPIATDIVVNYSYFQHTDGDFFGPGSYDGVIPYQNIPPYVEESGLFIPLQSAIDLRPVEGTTGNYTSNGGQAPRLPASTDIMQCNVDYYLPRLDRVYVTSDAEIKVEQGVPAFEPSPPNIPINGAMLLHSVYVEPYTYNENDVSIFTPQNRGYQMADIGRLSDRIDNLEEFAVLTAAENSLINIEVEDGVGDARRKLGLVGDGFSDWNNTAATSPDHKASISRSNRVMIPRNIKRDLEFTVDLSNSSGVVVKGGQVWPQYTEVAMITQPNASSSENVNQFSLSKFRGDVELTPSHDYWTITKTTRTGLGKSGTNVQTIDGNLSIYEGE